MEDSSSESVGLKHMLGPSTESINSGAIYFVFSDTVKVGSTCCKEEDNGCC